MSQRYLLTALSCFSLIACGGESLPSGSLNDENQTDGGVPAEVTPDYTPRELAIPSAGTCPSFDAPGKFTLTSNGVERNTYVFFPPERPEDMPVVFAWHPLGYSAEALNSWASSLLFPTCVLELKLGAFTAIRAMTLPSSTISEPACPTSSMSTFIE